VVDGRVSACLSPASLEQAKGARVGACWPLLAVLAVLHVLGFLGFLGLLGFRARPPCCGL